MQGKKQKQIRLNEYSLISNILNDDAVVSGLSESLIIENIIVSHYMNPKYADCIRSLYEQDGSIGKTLSLIWIKILTYDTEDMLDLVKFAGLKTKMCVGLPDPQNPEWHHFLGLLESFSLYLQAAFKHTQIISQNKDKEWLDALIKSYTAGDISIGFYPIYQLIINNWEILKDKTKIYNLLQSMAELQTGWLNLPADRIELMCTLKK